MKILNVIPSYEPAWAFGGTVTATSNICRALAAKGIDIAVYTTDADGKGGYLDVPLNEPVELGGVKVWYFHCDLFPRKGFYSKGLAKKLRESVKDFNIVYVSAIWQYIQVDVYNACKLFSVPYIVSPHGSFSPYSWNQKRLKKELYWILLGKKTICNASAIRFTTYDERVKAFSNIKDLAKIPSFILPNGIEIKNAIKTIDMKKNLGIPENSLLLLFVGRIHKVKGIHLILEAMSKYGGKNVALIMVGPREDKDYADKLNRLAEKASGRIFWYDLVPHNKIWDFYISADLFVLPSYHENFSNVTVEAMACGLPVLISREVGIWKEVEEDKAGFVVSDDVDEIADVLKKCVDNPELLKQLSENARMSAEKRYDINKVADLMIKAYEDVLTGRRSPELQWM